jgi:hypothetical protein
LIRQVDVAGESIDQLVRDKIAAGEDLYRLDEDRFRSCDPTHVLTQDLCRVCALPAGEAVLARLPERAAVWAIDADGLMVRPGPRLVDGIEALASIFHPDEFFRHTAVRQIR